MIDSGPYRKGVKAIFLAKWNLLLRTPLCIKSGTISNLTSSDRNPKDRNKDLEYYWNKEAPQEHERKAVQVSEGHFDLAADDGRLKPVYSIPASTIRGALRSWTIRTFVQDDENRILLSRPEDLAESGENLPGLKDRMEDDPGLALVIDLFGLVVQKPESGEEILSRAGRLQVETGPLSLAAPMPDVQGNWLEPEKEDPWLPGNSARHISVRGPVDRITQGARHGGLHYFLEFTPGQDFNTIIRLVNPQPWHLGLIWLWEKRIREGIIRFGGLKAVGRGRVTIKPESKTLSFSTDHQNWATMGKEDKTGEDILAQLWSTRDLADVSFDQALAQQLKRWNFQVLN